MRAVCVHSRCSFHAVQKLQRMSMQGDEAQQVTPGNGSKPGRQCCWVLQHAMHLGTDAGVLAVHMHLYTGQPGIILGFS